MYNFRVIMHPINQIPESVKLTIIAATLIFLLLGAFLVFILLYFRNIKNKDLLEKENLKITFQQTILSAQLEIQEQTFNHISQEIHDNVGQILSLAKVQINIMKESEDLNKDMLDEVKQNISKALTDLRDIAKSLSSERIRSMSIVDAVKIETERINKSGIIHA